MHGHFCKTSRAASSKLGKGWEKASNGKGGNGHGLVWPLLLDRLKAREMFSAE